MQGVWELIDEATTPLYAPNEVTVRAPHAFVQGARVWHASWLAQFSNDHLRIISHGKMAGYSCLHPLFSNFISSQILPVILMRNHCVEARRKQSTPVASIVSHTYKFRSVTPHQPGMSEILCISWSLNLHFSTCTNSYIAFRFRLTKFTFLLCRIKRSTLRCSFESN